jgi:nitrogen fixation NifU-like protein
MVKGIFKFSKIILEHFTDPRNVGGIVNPDGVGHVTDPSHGIDLELYIKINDSIITDAKFKAFGCAATIATISMVSEMLEGKSIDQALAISENEISMALDGLPPSKMHCARLGRELIESAIGDFNLKKG